MSEQGRNEPDVVGAKDRNYGAGPGDDQEQEIDVEDLTTDELLALSRAAESRMNVFTQLSIADPDRHSDGLEKAKADFQKYAEALKEHNYDPTGAMIDPSLTVPDKEGTNPTMADATGTYAEDAVVANIGGIGINDSNADPEGALEKLQEQAGRDMADTRGTSPLMDRRTTLKARREAKENEAKRPKSMSERVGRRGSRERVPLEREASEREAT